MSTRAFTVEVSPSRLNEGSRRRPSERTGARATLGTRCQCDPTLPDTSEAENHFFFSVRNNGKQKGFVWAWNERVEPKKPRVPRTDVVAVRVADRFDKEVLLASDEVKFFTEPHYNRFPAVLVRLPMVEIDELEELIIDAWRCQAPRALVDDFERHKS